MKEVDEAVASGALDRARRGQQRGSGWSLPGLPNSEQLKYTLQGRIVEGGEAVPSGGSASNKLVALVEGGLQMEDPAAAEQLVVDWEAEDEAMRKRAAKHAKEARRRARAQGRGRGEDGGAEGQWLDDAR